MSKRFLISVATAALLAGAGFANAQNAQAPASGSSPGSAAQHSAPPAAGSADRAAPTARDSASDSKGADSGMKSSQSDDKAMPQKGSTSQHAQDNAPGQKSKTMSSDSNSDTKAGKEMKADSRDNKMNNAESKSATESKTGEKSAADTKAPDAKSGTTTGQAGAGAKLSTEQRTKITTVIKQQNIQPVTNVNFSVSVGTRVPRETHFHALPAEIVTVYPDWRGYEFILVNNQIVVVNPRTFEIVAIIDA